MNIKKMLQFADEIVFTQTGQHLDDLQAAILQGTLQRETYKQIAKDFDCSESSVRNTGAELWRILSEELGEDVNKSNLRSTMERLQNSNVLNFAQDVVVSSSFNTCEQGRHPPDIPNSPQQQHQQTSNSKPSKPLHQDLSEMPVLGAFYSRTPELETLKTWILEQRIHLIAITGMSGIGKTTLAVQLVQQIKDPPLAPPSKGGDRFEYILWCSLETSPTLTELQDKLSEFFSQTENKPLPLMKHLKQYRCLVVLDDVHTLFSGGELAGKYQPGYEDYRGFFKQIEQLSHQSCFILIGWEPAIALPQIPNPKNTTRTLQLTGLDLAAAREIFKDCGLAEIENDSALIDCYQGNPLWLKSVATQIQELGESVTNLLPDDTILLPEDLQEVLCQQFNRLSEIELQVLSLLAKQREPINLATLIEYGTMPGLDLFNALQSLLRRCLIEKIDNCYTLLLVVRQSIKMVCAMGKE